MKTALLAIVCFCASSVLCAQELLGPRADFSARFEKEGGTFEELVDGGGGTFLVSGEFTGLGSAAHGMIVRFRENGAVDTGFVPAPITGSRVIHAVVQPDGKILICGEFYEIGGEKRLHIARLNSDGNLDTSFAPPEDADIRAWNLGLQPTGDVLVAFGNGVLRLHRDGSRDAAFTLGSSVEGTIFDLVVLPDGRFVLAGDRVAFVSGAWRNVARFGVDGALDSSFVTTTSIVSDVDLDAAGRVLTNGSVRDDVAQRDVSPVRLLANGSVDPSFHVGTGFSYTPTQISVHPDGRIFAAGFFWSYDGVPCGGSALLREDGSLDGTYTAPSTNPVMQKALRLPNGSVFGAASGKLIRLNPDGTSDASFAADLRVAASVRLMRELPTGEWLVGGDFTRVNGALQATVAILESDGAFDASFNTGAKLTGTVGQLDVDSVGRILVGGQVWYADSGVTRVGMVRFNRDGSLDSSFALPSQSAQATYLTFTFQADGRILVGNLAVGPGFDGPPLVRLLADGSLDPSFENHEAFSSVRAIFLAEDGRVLVAGTASVPNWGYAGRITRLNTDGSRDDTYNPDLLFSYPPSAFARHPDGGIVACGSFGTVAGTPRPFIAKIGHDGELDVSFNPQMPYNSSAAYAVAINGSGHIWLWGSFGEGKPLMRILPQGGTAPQPQFVGALTSAPLVLAPASNGEIAIGGFWSVGSLQEGGMAILDHVSPPRIRLQPSTGPVEVGGSLALKVTADGVNLAYQWFKDDVALDGATQSTLSIASLDAFDGGTYSVRVSDAFGSVTSIPVAVKGSQQPPSVNGNPAVSAFEGAPATLSVSASGSGPLRYEWRYMGKPIAGAAGPTLSFASVKMSDAGLYEVRVADGMSVSRFKPIRLEVFPHAVAKAYVATPAFGPKLEKSGGMIRVLASGAGGNYYVAGRFSGIGAASAAEVARFRSDDSPDDTFRPAPIHDGMVLTVAEQPDGKVLIGGTFRHVGGVVRHGVARLDANGALDTTFSSGSGLTPRFEGWETFISAIAVLPDGRVVLGGDFSAYNGVTRKSLVRVLANGSVDTSFSPSSDAVNGTVYALALQSSGHVLVGGISEDPVTRVSRCLARLDSSGAADPQFTIAAEFKSAVVSLVKQVDGRVLVGIDGMPDGYNPTLFTRGVLRLKSDGTLDSEFTSPFSPSSIDSIAPMADGRVLVAGQMAVEGQASRICVARLGPTGTLETVVHGQPANASEPQRAFGVVAHANGSLVAAVQFGTPWSSGVTADRSTQVWRFGPDGSRDLGFQGSSRNYATLSSLIEAGEGKLALGGDFEFVNGAPQGGIVLIKADGTVDPSFVAHGGFDGAVSSLAVDVHGRLVVGGSFTRYSGAASRRLARINRDGSWDAAFNMAETLTVTEEPRSVALDTVGNLLVAASVQRVDLVRRYVLTRLHNDGTLDESFDTASLPFSAVVQTALVLPDDRILAAGLFSPSQYSQIPLIRLLADGRHDPSLVADGQVMSGNALARWADGTVIVGGMRGVRRFREDGALDSAYYPLMDNVAAIRGLPDGSCLLGVQANVLGSAGLRSITATGNIDSAFLVHGGMAARGAVTVRSIVLSSGGRLVLAGENFSFENGSIGPLVQLEPAAIPRITAQPVTRRAAPGSNVSFAVAATGDNPRYQWYHDDVAIAGATNATLALNNVQLGHAGVYRVEVTNDYGAEVSQPVELLGPNPKPMISGQPATTVAVSGTAVTLRVSATGTGSLQFQWRKLGRAIPGANSPDLILPAVSMMDAGFYDVVVNDGLSLTVSGTAELRVRPAFYPQVLRPRVTFAPRIERLGATAHALVVTRAGDTIVGGSFTRVGDRSCVNLVRFRPDGQVDATFAPPVLNGAGVYALAEQSDGRLVVAGDFLAPGQSGRRNIIRLNSDGTSDTTFVPPEDISGAVRAVEVMADGRILIGGDFQSIGGSHHPWLARLGPTGALEQGYPAGDFALTSSVLAIRAREDGAVYIGGSFYAFGTGRTCRKFARLSADGTLDPTLYPGPEYHTSGPGDDVTAIEITEDGGALVGGRFDSISIAGTFTSCSGLVKMTATGGLAAIYSSETWTGRCSSFVVQNDGRILVASYLLGDDNWTSSRVRRLNADLTVDSSYSSDATLHGTVEAICVAPGGGYVAAGNFDQVGAVETFCCARIDQSGEFDASLSERFYRVGTVEAALPGAANSWYVAGRFDCVNGISRGNIAHILADGTLDTVYAAGAGFDAGVAGMRQTGDGSLLVWGDFTTCDGVVVAPVVRLTAQGLRDAAFTASFPEDSLIEAVSIERDGRILVSGFTGSGSMLWRLDSLGRPVRAWTPVYVPSSAPRLILARANGDAYLGGNDVIAKRVRADLSLDDAFQPSIPPPAQVYSIARSGENAIFVAGRLSYASAEACQNIVRILDDGETDAGFAGAPGVFSVIQSIEPQEDGAAVIAGNSLWAGSTISPALARVKADGTLDDRFILRQFTNAGHVTGTAYCDDGSLMVYGERFEAPNVLGAGMVLLEPTPDPEILVQPSEPEPAVAGGRGITLRASVAVNGEATMQWQVSNSGATLASTGADIPLVFQDVAGANSPELRFPVPQQFHNGAYRFVIRTNGREIVSDVVQVRVGPSPGSTARVMNLSTRALDLTGDNLLIPGFVISGTGTKRILVRAVGPGLFDTFGLQGYLGDPQLTLRNQDTGAEIAANDDWGTSADKAAIIATSQSVGAFPLLESSKDSVLVVNLPAGHYTAPAVGAAGGTGIAMVELYDADPDNTGGARLVNISNRGFVDVGDKIMIPGFVVSNEGSRTFLIRAVGPGLRSTFGLQGILEDPVLTVFNSGGQAILSNDDWDGIAGSTTTSTIAGQVGAFPLVPGSADAAFVVTLPPGGYTIQATGKAGTTGVALVEVYVVP